MSLKLAKFKSAHQGQKVDHPLAKYNSKGDLYCLLCNTLIKNANVWKVHLSSRTHKENMILFKSGKNKKPDSMKRPAPKIDEAPPRSLKKLKSQNTQNSVNEAKSTKSPSANDMSTSSSITSGILKPSSKVVPKLPEGFVPKSRLKDSSPTVSTALPAVISSDVLRAAEIKSNLPTGFFDDNIVPTLDVNSSNLSNGNDVAEEEEEESKPNNPVSNLPDGFFDDAREDAKARKVEYKDPQELEWEKYQSEMEQEDIRYNTILEEDDKKLREERDVGIGIEQKLWDYRVESMAESVKTGQICVADKQAFESRLRKHEKFEKDEIKDEEMHVKQESLDVDVKMEDDNMSSDDDYDDVMDWRIKKGL